LAPPIDPHTEWILVFEVTEGGIRSTAVQGGEPVRVERIGAPNAGELTTTLAKAAQRSLERLEGSPRRSVVVIDGLFDVTTGVLARSLPSGRWTDEVVVARLEELTGMPAALLRNGEAGAIGERVAGAGAGHDNFLYLFVDRTDLHVGMFADGHLDRSIRRSFGQNIVDVRTNRASAAGVRGALAAFASIDGMLHARRDELGTTCAEDDEAVSLLVDEVGLAVLDDGASHLAHALHGVRHGILIPGITFASTDTIIVATHGAHLQDALEARVSSHLRSMDCDRGVPTWNVVGSALRDRATTVGASMFDPDGDQRY
jgi:predicted NBD/HSP70 family sugar kinase